MIIKEEEFISKSEEDTKLIALNFVKEIESGNVIVLNGQLGSGKTFIVKKISEYYNISNTSSPTFAIVNEYFGDRKIYHFDFYRINSINELHDIGFEDYISDSEAITFIEWGELFPEILPHSRYEISIEFFDEDSRKIVIRKYE
jgi:tRNA threonylcarbamoyladenosine biosynthesis protein TsaE